MYAMDKNMKIRPVWTEINLDALAHNMREARRLAKPSALVMGVVKADAYGHGAVKVSKTLIDNGADMLGVAILSEAIELRKAGYTVPILILGYTNPEQYADLIRFGIEQTIYDYEMAQLLSEEAKKQKEKVKIHLKIDTGMRRLGFEPNAESIDAILRISKLENLDIVGIFSHFSEADSKDKQFSEAQYRKLMWVCDRLDNANLIIPIKHIANSAAIIDLPETHMDMVRAGIMLYCLSPSIENTRAVDLKQVMTLKARISNVKHISAGESVGYGRAYFADKPIVVATLPIGYADGYTRKLTGKGYALVHGKKVQLIGRICMDQCMLDVTAIEDVRIGDVAVLFGEQGDKRITIDELAMKLGTINHEIVCGISRRVPRVYIKNNMVVDYTDHLTSSDNKEDRSIK
jgi:alanine racemase